MIRLLAPASHYPCSTILQAICCTCHLTILESISMKYLRMGNHLLAIHCPKTYVAFLSPFLQITGKTWRWIAAQGNTFPYFKTFHTL